MSARRWVEEGVHEEVPQNEQVLIVVQGNEVPVILLDMNHREVRVDLLTLARVIKTHVNKGVEPRVNALERTMASLLGVFVRMNPSIFLCSNVGEDPQEFLDCVYKLSSSIGVTFKEKAELSSYHLMDVSQI